MAGRPESGEQVETFKSVAGGLGIAFAGWIVGLIVLIKATGLIWGGLLATFLAGGGFVCWLLIAHPQIGGIVVDELLNPDDVGDWGAAEKAKRQEEERQGRKYVDRARRGDRRDST